VGESDGKDGFSVFLLFRRYTFHTVLESIVFRRKWRRLVLLLVLAVLIGSAQVYVLRRLYGIPSLQAFVAIAIVLGLCDVLFAWNIERTTRREGPELWNSLIGRQGRVLSEVGEHGASITVRVAGEIWTACCRHAAVLKRGEKVRVTARKGLVLEVEPWDRPADRQESHDSRFSKTVLPDASGRGRDIR